MKLKKYILGKSNILILGILLSCGCVSCQEKDEPVLGTEISSNPLIGAWINTEKFKGSSSDRYAPGETFLYFYDDLLQIKITGESIYKHYLPDRYEIENRESSTYCLYNIEDNRIFIKLKIINQTDYVEEIHTGIFTFELNGEELILSLAEGENIFNRISNATWPEEIRFKHIVPETGRPISPIFGSWTNTENSGLKKIVNYEPNAINYKELQDIDLDFRYSFACISYKGFDKREYNQERVYDLGPFTQKDYFKYFLEEDRLKLIRHDEINGKDLVSMQSIYKVDYNGDEIILTLEDGLNCFDYFDSIPKILNFKRKLD